MKDEDERARKRVREKYVPTSGTAVSRLNVLFLRQATKMYRRKLDGTTRDNGKEPRALKATPQP